MSARRAPGLAADTFGDLLDFAAGVEEGCHLGFKGFTGCHGRLRLGLLGGLLGAHGIPLSCRDKKTGPEAGSLRRSAGLR